MPGYLIRHGETPLNVRHLTRGTEQGIPLTKFGVQQAHRMGRMLKGAGITSLRSSDRRHIVQTANIIGSIIGVKNNPTAALRSLDIGNLTEQPVDEIDPVVTKKIVEESDAKVGGGQSPREWIKTVWPELRRFLTEVKDGKTPALVTHGRPLNIARAAVGGNGQFLHKESLKSYPTEKHGSVYSVEWDGKEFSMKGPIAS